MILESLILSIKPGQSADFEKAFRDASPIIAGAKGYITHTLNRCIETPDRYLLQVQWQTLDDHMVGFRGSEGYQDWRARLHHFYDPMPTMEHFEPVALS